MTRDVNGFDGSLICCASSSRPLPNLIGIGWFPVMAVKKCRGSMSPGFDELPRINTRSSSPVPSIMAIARRDLRTTFELSCVRSASYLERRNGQMRGTDAMPSAAAGVSSEADAESFAAWASTQRRRAACSCLTVRGRSRSPRRVVNGTTIRSVASWHDAAKQVGTSSRRAPQQGTDVPARPEQSSTRSATDELRPQRLTARQRRSALRSATHHRLMRLRVLRVHLLAVRFLVRLSHLSAATRALRSGPSPGKRRLSPSPEEQQDPLLHTTPSCSDGASEQPEVSRAGWVRRVLSRVGFGDG